MAVVISDEQKDATLTQFLSMMEDRVDPDVAKNLLEAVGWDVQTATEQIYGGQPTPAATRPGTSMSVDRDMLASLEAEDMAMNVERQGGFMPAMPAMMPGAARGHGAVLGPAAMGGPPQAHGGLDGEEEVDPQLQAQMDAVIAASFASQTGAGQAQTDEEMLAQAMAMSQQEEDARQRQALREQQEAELAESELMDQMREHAAQEQREQEAAVERSRLEEEQRQAAELQAKRARVPEEPPAGEAGRLALMFRLPDGQRVQRAFRSTEAVGSLYDFLDVHAGQELSQRRYRLVSTMPRREFVDREQKLSEAGIQNQFVLMAELTSDL